MGQVIGLTVPDDYYADCLQFSFFSYSAMLWNFLQRLRLVLYNIFLHKRICVEDPPVQLYLNQNGPPSSVQLSTHVLAGSVQHVRFLCSRGSIKGIPKQGVLLEVNGSCNLFRYKSPAIVASFFSVLLAF